MSSALLLNLSVGTALADEVVETGADNSPKVEATESTPVEQPSDSQSSRFLKIKRHQQRLNQ